MASSQDPKTYLATLNDFIATFPDSPDGYLNRANHYAYHRADLAPTEAEQGACLDKALEDINTGFPLQRAERGCLVQPSQADLRRGRRGYDLE